MRGSRKARAVVVLFAVFGLLGGLLSGVAQADADPTLPDPASIGPFWTFQPAHGMQPESDGDDRCSGQSNGWEMVRASDDEFSARRLEGEVVIGHPPHGDWIINHHTEDYNFFVVPDDHNPLASDPNADYSFLLAKGNFGTGEPKEIGRIEVENEYGALPWNNAGSAGYFGLPPWVWPATGDRAIVDGYWIYDCGHNDNGFRSEIHPAWMVVTERNMMESEIARGASRAGSVAALGSDDREFSPATKADVWISSFGGEAVEDSLDELGPNGEDWWQPVNSKDYDFDIPAPAKPSPDATLTMQIQEPPGSYWRPPGAVGPSFDLSNMTPVERNGRTFVHVHIPFSSVATKPYMLFAKTLIVGWDVPAPDVKHFRITVNRWNVFNDLETVGEAEYSPWLQSGDQNTFVRISDGGDPDEATTFDCTSDDNYMPYCEPDNGENSFVDNASVDVFVNGHDPLIVQFRAKEEDLPAENDDAGFASQSFTATENWGVGNHILFQSDDTFAGEYADFKSVPTVHDPCDGDGPANNPDTCYAVDYTITRITDPTAVTIGVPNVQYAQDPNKFTATVATPGGPGFPDTPRRRLPVTFTLFDGTHSQVLHAVTDDNGLAAPTDLLTVPAGDYQLTAEFAGNGLLTASSTSQPVTVTRDFTSTTLAVAAKIRWGHQDPFKVTLTEPNIGQDEGPLGIAGKNVTITLTGPLGTQTYLAGPTAADGTATIAPLMTLPPGDYQATACFAEDPWFRGSCSGGQTVRVTPGYTSFATGGPIAVSGGSNTAIGDLHSEGSATVSGTGHVLSAGPGERFEYVTTFTDNGTGNQYHKVQVPALGMAPSYLRSTYCTGAPTLFGVPVTYVNQSITFKNDEVLSGIYCVTGDIKIQSRVSGSAVLLATGPITTSGGDQNLVTADPTGADLLMRSGSADSKSISILGTTAKFKGALVATGGVYVAAKDSVFQSYLGGSQVLIAGSGNLLKTPQ